MTKWEIVALSTGKKETFDTLETARMILWMMQSEGRDRFILQESKEEKEVNK